MDGLLCKHELCLGKMLGESVLSCQVEYGTSGFPSMAFGLFNIPQPQHGRGVTSSGIILEKSLAAVICSLYSSTGFLSVSLDFVIYFLQRELLEFI